MKWPSLFSRLRRTGTPAERSDSERSSLPAELLAALRLGKASALRELLKAHSVDGANLPTEALLDHAREAAWPTLELDKLAAYGEFFFGNSAAGYHRVMSGHLADTDFGLFMTAATFCYLYDRFEEAYQLLRQFREREAESLDLVEFLAFAGYITLAAGRNIGEATAYFDRALDQGLHSSLLAVNAYPIYFESGQHERVRQLREIIHCYYAEDPETTFSIACVELCRDYYPEGFRLAEARYGMPEVGRSINPSLLTKRRWQGGAIAGKRLLVHGEQGYGDVIMMARYLPLLKQIGAEVVVDCREAAVSLLSFNFPDCEVVAGDQKSPVAAEFDSWTGVMSLPYHFKTTAQTVPATSDYLRVPPEQSAYWQQRVSDLAPAGGARIGIAWSGNPSHRADKRRSLPFQLIAPYLQSIAHVHFFALQTSVPTPHPQNLIDASEEMITLADTAALIEQMDLVLTVDTSIVHIAGALGKKTWLLLPKRYEWRWGLQGEANNWYKSVRVLRQETHGDWGQLLDEIFRQRLPPWLATRKELQ